MCSTFLVGDVGQTDVPFIMQDTTDLVLKGNKVMTVAQAFDHHAKKAPAADLKVAYHKNVESPTDDHPDLIKFEPTHQVLWTAEPGAPVKNVDGVPTMDADHIGDSKSTSYWTAHDILLTVIWGVRWSTHGLAPTRPYLVLDTNRAINLPPGKSLRIA